MAYAATKSTDGISFEKLSRGIRLVVPRAVCSSVYSGYRLIFMHSSVGRMQRTLKPCWCCNCVVVFHLPSSPEICN